MLVQVMLHLGIFLAAGGLFGEVSMGQWPVILLVHVIVTS